MAKIPHCVLVMKYLFLLLFFKFTWTAIAAKMVSVENNTHRRQMTVASKTCETVSMVVITVAQETICFYGLYKIRTGLHWGQSSQIIRKVVSIIALNQNLNARFGRLAIISRPSGVGEGVGSGPKGASFGTSSGDLGGHRGRLYIPSRELFQPLAT